MPSNLFRFVSLALLSVMMLAGCSTPTPTATPMPTDTPAPTNTPSPTNTPVPTVDAASLPLADLEATAVALEELLVEARAREASTSSAGEKGAIMQEIRRIEGRIEDVTALIEAVGDSAEEPVEGAADSAMPTLTLSGDFAEAKDWGWADLEELEMITATVAGPKDDDPEAEYTGVSLVAMLEDAGLADDATILVATAADGFETEIEVAALKDCTECMLVLEDGSLRLILPGFASRAWVWDLVSLEAK